MTRPRCACKIGMRLKCRSFKPADQAHSECVELLPEEAESLRLKDVCDLDQIVAAEKMGISQSSFQRILTSARKKVSDAIINGKAINIILK